MTQTNKQTNKQTSKFFVTLAMGIFLMQSCTKEQTFPEVKNTSSTNASQNQNGINSANYNNYAVYATQQAFEESMFRFLALDSLNKIQFEDSLISLGIMPLRRTLEANDETWVGLENLTSVVNKDNLIQIGDKIIKIDMVNNVAYILTPANTEYLTNLKNNQLVDGFIYLHETLEKPIFDVYENGEGYGKGGVFCKDGWAERKVKISYSWDDLWQVYMPTTNGTLGVRWVIRYSAGGIWFSLTKNGTVVNYWNGVTSTSAEKSMVQHHLELTWRRRCGQSESLTDPIEKGTASLNFWNGNGPDYTSPRALQRYSFKFWARHNNGTTANFNAYDWPMEISSNR